jgi:hypothetical protein
LTASKTGRPIPGQWPIARPFDGQAADPSYGRSFLWPIRPNDGRPMACPRVNQTETHPKIFFFFLLTTFIDYGIFKMEARKDVSSLDEKRNDDQQQTERWQK